MNNRPSNRILILVVAVMLALGLVPLVATAARTAPDDPSGVSSLALTGRGAGGENHPLAPTALSWYSETVATSGSLTGSSINSSLAVDSAGGLHVGYCHATSYDSCVALAYAHQVGGLWVTQTVTTSLASWQKLGIAADSTNHPHIAYVNASYDLAYASFDGAAWQSELVQSHFFPSGNHYDPSLALNSADRAHIAYVTSGGTGDYLQYVHFDGTQWQTATVDVLNTKNSYPSLALDNTGRPAIAYLNGIYPNAELRYAHYNGTQWVTETVPVMVTALAPSLALDSAEHLYIAFRGSPSGLGVAHYDGSVWVGGAVPGVSSPQYVDITLDKGGQPHLVYNTSFTLGYAHYDGAAWSTETIPTSFDQKFGLGGLTLDNTGRLHTTYYDMGSHTVNYLWTDVPQASGVVSIDKQVSPTTVNPGGSLTYTLRLNNGLTTTLTSIVITDVLPATVLTPQVSSNVVITVQAGTRYVWNVANLAPGASAFITIAGQISANPASDSIANSAQFSSNAGSGQAQASVYLVGVFVTKTGSGRGQVTSAPPGIACGADCSQRYALGTVVTLTATPLYGSQFCGWTGGGCSGSGACVISVNTSHQVTACFGGKHLDATIGAVRNGDWNNPATWSLGRVPNAQDVVEIGAAYTVNTPAAQVKIQTLYNDGILQSTRNAALDLKVSDTLSNTGVIRGQDGGGTIGTTCGAAGSDVILRGAGFTGGKLQNTGTIQGGAGLGRGCCGGNGGTVTLAFDGSMDNAGLVTGGTGGNILTCCASSTPGKGGNVVLLGAGHAYLGLHSSGDIRGGTGGNQPTGCGNQSGACGGSIVMASNPVAIFYDDPNKLAHIWGGRAGLNSNGVVGQCQGNTPSVHLDPNNIEIWNAQLAADELAIFGGPNWTMALTNTTTGAISATGGITLAVGPGGSIDLRGCQPGAFTADTFFVASDNVLLDAGKTLSDVVNAPVIQQASAQILGDIAVSAPGFVSGLRGESLAVPIVLVNNSPITFTYNLTTTGGSGLPAVASLGPVSGTVVTLTVVAPAAGGEQVYTVTAKAQVGPFQSDSAVIHVYAPPATALATLSGPFSAGLVYPFTGTLGCGSVTFASAWTGQVTVTMGEITPPGADFLSRVYTTTVSGAAPAATLKLCYDESDVAGAGLYSDTPLAIYQNAVWLPSERAADDSSVIGYGATLPGVYTIGAGELHRLYLPVVLKNQ